MVANPPQHISEPGMRIDIIELRGDDQIHGYPAEVVSDEGTELPPHALWAGIGCGPRSGISSAFDPEVGASHLRIIGQCFARTATHDMSSLHNIGPVSHAKSGKHVLLHQE
jgi:hypothetical protein